MIKAVFVIIFLIASLALARADDTGTITVHVAEPGKCTLYFKQGWTLFSFCSELENTNLKDVFSGMDGKYRYIMRWNKTSQAFDIYSPRAVTKPFTTLDDNESYFIYIEEASTINIPGDEAGSETRTLVKGWSTPSYPYRFTTTIQTLVAGIGENFRYLMKWNTDNQAFDIYSPRAITKPFYEINTGEGQFIYMENPNILKYEKPV